MYIDTLIDKLVNQTGRLSSVDLIDTCRCILENELAAMRQDIVNLYGDGDNQQRCLTYDETQAAELKLVRIGLYLQKTPRPETLEEVFLRQDFTSSGDELSALLTATNEGWDKLLEAQEKENAKLSELKFTRICTACVHAIILGDLSAWFNPTNQTWRHYNCELSRGNSVRLGAFSYCNYVNHDHLTLAIASFDAYLVCAECKAGIERTIRA